MIGSARRQGQPLWALGALLLAWLAARAMLFESPLVPPSLIEGARSIARLVEAPPPPTGVEPAPRAKMTQARPVRNVPRSPSPPHPRQVVDATRAVLSPLPTWPDRPIVPPLPHSQIVAHNLLWMAAMGGIPRLPEVGPVLATRQVATPPPAASQAQAAPRRSRWSGDGWLSWRAGTQGLVAPGPVAPTYGGSQAGAVLRYELAPGSPRQPAAYLRAVRALGRAREGDVAAGFALRPMGAVPVSVHAEARLSRRGSTLALRPAAFVSGGIESAPLGAGITARGYGQAGYVGGPDATAFADGSLIAEKSLWRGGEQVLTAGAGAWGGAQRGTARLDLGPTASLRIRLGEGTARLSADYRLRIAGNAEPASGAAVTLSAGF